MEPLIKLCKAAAIAESPCFPSNGLDGLAAWEHCQQHCRCVLLFTGEGHKNKQCYKFISTQYSVGNTQVRIPLVTGVNLAVGLSPGGADRESYNKIELFDPWVSSAIVGMDLLESGRKKYNTLNQHKVTCPSRGRRSTWFRSALKGGLFSASSHVISVNRFRVVASTFNGEITPQCGCTEHTHTHTQTSGSGVWRIMACQMSCEGYNLDCG